ncbi:MAG: hypothetical protein WDM70_03060 [Nitrosomonadales bacterium]
MFCTERNILLTVVVEDKPYVTTDNRFLIKDMGKELFLGAGILWIYGIARYSRSPGVVYLARIDI